MFPAPRQRWIDALASPEEDIAKIEAPALIIHGREDRILPYSNSVRLFELIPNSQLHMFGKCGHWTQIEHAGRFNKLLLDFYGED
jgi:2-hydroxymuconate-semialdehyde hydrolase